MAMRGLSDYVDESVPVHADIGRGHPMVIFSDHRFCAGKSLAVHEMPSPHMHSQIELNFLLEGAMTYWFNGRVLDVSAGRFVLFWGMIPHQVIRVEPDTRFVCFYVPISVFLGLPALSNLRGAIFRGGVIEALEIRPFDRDIFLRWREELLTGDPQLETIVRDEMTARVRRLDREGWQDLRADAPLALADVRAGAERMLPIEKMTRFIGENGRSKISVDDVARASGLHPNYAMHLFRRAVGMSIKEAITRHRLDAAQSLLIATDQAIAAIAFDCGFASLSSFYAAFAKRFVASPAQFRRALGHPVA